MENIKQQEVKQEQQQTDPGQITDPGTESNIEKPIEKSFTQEEVNKMIEKRLAREKKDIEANQIQKSDRKSVV